MKYEGGANTHSPSPAAPAKAQRHRVASEGPIFVEKSFWLKFIRARVLLFIVRHRPVFLSLEACSTKRVGTFHAFANTTMPCKLHRQQELLIQHDTDL
jgi:hypothetical protein